MVKLKKMRKDKVKLIGVIFKLLLRNSSNKNEWRK